MPQPPSPLTMLFSRRGLLATRLLLRRLICRPLLRCWRNAEPDRSAFVAGRVEVADFADMLGLDDSPASAGIRLGHLETRLPLRHLAVRHRFAEHAAEQLAVILDLQVKQRRRSPAEFGFAGRRRIGKALPEIGPGRASDD